jgi:hypothetical protein
MPSVATYDAFVSPFNAARHSNIQSNSNYLSITIMILIFWDSHRVLLDAPDKAQKENRTVGSRPFNRYCQSMNVKQCSPQGNLVRAVTLAERPD